MKGLPPTASVHIKAGILRSLGLLRGGEAVRLLWPGAALLVFGVVLLAIPFRWLRRRGKAGRADPTTGGTSWWQSIKPLRWSLGMAALVGWLFTLGLVWSIGQLLTSDQSAVLLLGLPSSAAPLFVLPKALAVLTAVACGAAVLAWRRPDWSRRARVFDLFGMAAAASFLAFLILFRLF